MNTASTLGTFAVGLTVVFVGAVGVGQAVGPVGAARAEHPAPRSDSSTRLPGPAQHTDAPTRGTPASPRAGAHPSTGHALPGR